MRHFFDCACEITKDDQCEYYIGKRLLEIFNTLSRLKIDFGDDKTVLTAIEY